MSRPTVGLLGAGQLARMLALAGRPLGIHCHALSSVENHGVTNIASVEIHDKNSADVLKSFAEKVDVLTFENENLPAESLSILDAGTRCAPTPNALLLSQDRLKEKSFLSSIDIPVAPHAPVDTLADLEEGLKTLGSPALLKTRTLGYDGKGQQRIEAQSDLSSLWQPFEGNACILEGWVNFAFEVSQIAVRNAQGEIGFYPLTHNTHRDGILRISRAPYDHAELAQQAQTYTQRLLEKLNYVGVLTIEFFVTQDHTLIANEIAPRVHNSGHWTIEGAHTSQFENHLRAICDLPLGSCEARGHSLMLNCIGTLPKIEDVLKIPGAHLHDYEKAPRPGRKLGHITLCGDSQDTLELAAQPLL